MEILLLMLIKTTRIESYMLTCMRRDLTSTYSQTKCRLRAHFAAERGRYVAKPVFDANFTDKLI